MMHDRRRIAVGLGAVLAACLLGPGAHASRGEHAVAARHAVMAITTDFSNPDAEFQLLTRPRHFVIHSADATLHVRHLRWRHWGGGHASAAGRAKWCESACHGSFAPYKLKVSHLVKPDHCSPRWYERVRQKFGGAWSDIPAGICIGRRPRAGSPSPARAARAAYFVPTSRDETGFGRFSETPRSDAHALRSAFGRATSAHRRGGDECVLRWRRLGITATVVTYGLVHRPCRNGYFFEARLTKRRWHTSKGIHPGSSEAAARRAALHRCGSYCGKTKGYVLGVHRSECAAGLYPGVIAAVGHHRVSSLVVETHGCE